MIRLVDDYLAIRRAAGFKLRGTEGRLRSFAACVAANGDSHIRVDTAIAWAGTAGSAHERHIRLADLAIFALHARAEDPRHAVIPRDVFAFKFQTQLPYIYSEENIGRILVAAGELDRSYGVSTGDSCRTVLGLLASTGLRIQEALSLKLRDITASGLMVRNTKFRKSRLVPLHPTVAAALLAYRARWRVVATLDDPLFVSHSGTALPYAIVHRVFHLIIEQLGLAIPPEAGHRRRPRIHDLRHTFAVRALEACPQGRAAIVGSQPERPVRGPSIPGCCPGTDIVTIWNVRRYGSQARWSRLGSNR